MLVTAIIATGLLVGQVTETVTGTDDGCNHVLTVNLQSNDGKKGQFIVSLFDGPKSFLKEPVATRFLPATTTPRSVSFDGLCPGTYALSGYHDQNSDGKLNTNFLGIPKEPAGFSNGARGRFGPAKFDQAKFEVTGDSSYQLLPVGKIKKQKKERKKR